MGSVEQTYLDVAVIGAGIVGAITTIGLLQRQEEGKTALPMRIHLYDQASGFHYFSVGMVFNRVSRTALELISPDLLEALRNSGATDASSGDPDAYLRYVDGYNEYPEEAKAAGDARYERHLYTSKSKDEGSWGCQRSMLLEQLAARIPEECVSFRKRLEGYEYTPEGRVKMTFQDGSTAQADLVIGCDGVKSYVRTRLAPSPDHPSARAHFTHSTVYRALVPMAEAEKVLGPKLAHVFHHQLGPKALVVHYPVADKTKMMAALNVRHPEPWPEEFATTMQAPDTREAMLEFVKDWHPNVRGLIGLMPETVAKWAFFDTSEHPIARYSDARRVCMAGDAAHAMTSHHAHGAGTGVEDVLCLVTVLGLVRDKESIGKALEVYDRIRRPRGQFVVEGARRLMEMYIDEGWKVPGSFDGPKVKEMFDEVAWRSKKVWLFDCAAMVEDATREFVSTQNGKAH